MEITNLNLNLYKTTKNKVFVYYDLDNIFNLLFHIYYHHNNFCNINAIIILI